METPNEKTKHVVELLNTFIDITAQKAGSKGWFYGVKNKTSSRICKIKDNIVIVSIGNFYTIANISQPLNSKVLSAYNYTKDLIDSLEDFNRQVKNGEDFLALEDKKMIFNCTVAVLKIFACFCEISISPMPSNCGVYYAHDYWLSTCTDKSITDDAQLAIDHIQKLLTCFLIATSKYSYHKTLTRLGFVKAHDFKNLNYISSSDRAVYFRDIVDIASDNRIPKSTDKYL